MILGDQEFRRIVFADEDHAYLINSNNISLEGHYLMHIVPQY